MKTMKWILMLTALICVGCATTRPSQQATGFSFSYNDTQYQINSITPHTLVGYNMLTLRDGDQIMMNAIDINQDGMIDEITKGNSTVEQAQAIYAHGIAQAKEKGSYYYRTLHSVYQAIDSQYEYSLQTFALAIGETYNKLIMKNRWLVNADIIVVDEKADGSLNVLEKGDDSLAKYQKIYESILERGIREGRISMDKHGIYQVALSSR